MDRANKLRVLHISTDLETGGSEVMLERLLGAMDRTRFEHAVLSLTTRGPIGSRIAAAGFPVSALGLRRWTPNPLRLVTLAGAVRAFRPDVIQTWMYDADLLGGLVAQVTGGAPVIWGIHNGRFDSAAPRQWRAMLVARACAALSRKLPRRILYCSETSRAAHAALGYDEARGVVIENGFDLDAFRPRPDARAALRRELGLAKDALVIGAISRFHAQKDPRTLIAAIGRLGRPDVHVVVCGGSLNTDNRTLARWIDEAGVRDRVHLLGRRDDVPHIVAALDLLVSPSFREAFPLVIGEAMAAGVPCVSTNAGDSAILIGDTGYVVPVRDPEALAGGLRRMLDLGADARVRLGAAARKRIAERFSLPSAAARYEALYEETVGGSVE